MIYEKLDNGLEIYLYEDRRSPIFSFVITYKVGSMDEYPGITGASHILEHMIFKGSEKVKGFDMNLMVRRHGGYFNASTHSDRTSYMMVMPSSEKEYVLSIWSDLMTNATIDSDEFERERSVVIEERRLHSEDNPMGALFEALNATAFWAHPYGWPVIGWMSDLERMTQDQIIDFYKYFYRPDNAVIVAKGDIEEKETLGLIKKHFGEIQFRISPIQRSGTIEPPQTGIRRSSIFKPAELPLIMMGFHAPAIKDNQVYPMLVCEKILSSGESSRIYRNIIHDQRLATGAGGYYDYLSRDPSLFIFYAQAAPDKNTKTLEQAMWNEIEKINSGDISFEEIEKAKNIVEAQFVYRQEKSLSEVVSRGDFHTVAGMQYYDSFVEKLREVSKDDIVNICRLVLKRDNCSVVDLQPTNERGKGANFEQSSGSSNYRCFYYKSPLKPDGLPFWDEADKFELSNGMRVIALKRDNLPILNIDLFFQAGAVYDPEDKGGLATLTGNMLKAGTESRSAGYIAEEIERLGGRFSVGVGRETLYTGVQCLSRYRKPVLDVLSDCLIYPVFSKNDVTRYKELLSGDIKSIEDDVWRLAPREFIRYLYAESAYGIPKMGSLESVDSINRNDIIKFHKSQITASNAIMCIVGDFSLENIRDELEFYFSKLPKGTVINPPDYMSKDFDSVQVKRYQRETSQASIVLGSYSFSRLSEDYFPSLILNLVFGGDSITSRIGEVIREKNGLAYFVQSSFNPMKKTGYWNIMMQTKNESVGKTVDLLRHEIRKVRNEYISDDEIADAKSSFRNRSALEVETNRGLAMKLLTVIYYDLGDDYLSTFFQNIDEVTKDQIRDAARRYFNPDKFLLMLVGDKDSTLTDFEE